MTPREKAERLLNLSEKATAGPWQIVTTEHPHYQGGKHRERRIFTTWDHPQMKGPLGVVNNSFGIPAEKGQPGIQMVYISEADALYITESRTLSDDIARALLEQCRAVEELLDVHDSMEKVPWSGIKDRYTAALDALRKLTPNRNEH